MITDNSFGKDERLSSAREIDRLFLKGRKFNLYPYRIIWTVDKEGEEKEIRIMISVPKKSFPRSVDRNLIRRRIREAYRTNKTILTKSFADKNFHSLGIAVIYTAKDIMKYDEIRSKLIAALENLVQLL